MQNVVESTDGADDDPYKVMQDIGLDPKKKLALYQTIKKKLLS
jgi:hypothetical protein